MRENEDRDEIRVMVVIYCDWTGSVRWLGFFDGDYFGEINRVLVVRECVVNDCCRVVVVEFLDVIKNFVSYAAFIL